jgi:hypothetical protein
MISKKIGKQQELYCHRCSHEWGYRRKNPFFTYCPRGRITVRIRKKESRDLVRSVRIDAHIQADIGTPAHALRREVYRLPVNMYQKITAGGYNKAHGHHIDETSKCHARGCAKLGRLLSKISDVSKSGSACDSYAEDLPQQATAVETEGISDHKR